MALPPRPSLFTLLLVLLALGAGCTPEQSAESGDGMEEAARAGEWNVLFNGSDLSAWRGYGQDDVPGGWQIDEGLLYFDPGIGGGDIVTREEYGDFELELDWRISECGNSGIFYRGAEGNDYVWQTAPEMQVLDDTCHTDARFPSHRAGSNYDLYTATPDIVRPAGEWNEVRIVARGPHVEHWLNGQKVVEYEQGSEAWAARVAASKFREMSGYGTLMSGVIGLQDHGDPVWFRDIRVRRLDG